MTERLSPAQRQKIEDWVGEVLKGLPLSRDVVQERVIGQGGLLKKRFAALVLALANAYFFLLSDEEAHEWLRKVMRKSEQEAKRHILGYRRGAQEHEIVDTEPCHIQVVSGATLKETIPQIGPCVEDFQYLREWKFSDPPTTDSMFSLVPKLLRGSTDKTVDEQKAFLTQAWLRWGLPEGGQHLSGFGSVTHLAGAAHACKAAGRDIFAGKIARTETCGSDGYRLGLNWDDGRLYCDYWFFDGVRYDYVGVLACGVEKALGS